MIEKLIFLSVVIIMIGILWAVVLTGIYITAVNGMYWGTAMLVLMIVPLIMASILVAGGA